MSSDVEEMRLIRVARGLRTRAEQRHDAATKVLSASLSAQEENDEAREQPQGLVWGEQKSGVGKRWSETRFGGRGHWKAERDRRAFFRPASFARASESEDEEAVGREGREGAAAEESGEDSEGRSLSSTFMRTKKAAENAKRATRRASEPGDSSAEPCASSVSRESPDKSCAFMAEDENEHEDLGPDRRANSDASPNHVPDDDDYLLGLDPEPPSAILVSDHHQTKERTARNESSQNRVVRSEVRGPVGKKDVINESDEEDTLEVLDPDADGAAALRRTMGLPCAFGEARASREANRQRIVRERFRNAAEDTGTRKTPGQIPSGRAKGAKEPSEEEGRASDEDASQPRSTTQNGGQARKGGRDGVTEGWSEREGRGEEERWRAMGLPVSLEVSVPAHSPSIVSAFALNPKANRMVTGGGDGVLRFWDFQGMTSGMRSYRQATPVEKHTVEALAFSTTHVLVAAGDCQLRLYDAQSPLEPAVTTTKGDMYIRDVANTKGHTHKVLDCHFHPLDRNWFLSCGLDASVRLWDVNAPLSGMAQTLPHTACLKAVDRRGLNSSATHCTSCAYTPTKADVVVVGCADGSLQFWGNVGFRRNFGRPDGVVRDAESSAQRISERARVTGVSAWRGQTTQGGPVSVTGLRAFKDDFRVVSRRADSKLALWDLRKFKEPLAVVAGDLPTASERAGVCLSPDEKFVCVTTQFEGVRPSSNEDKTRGHVLPPSSPAQAGGAIEVFEAQSLKRVASFAVSRAGASPLRVEWPEETNQILASCSDGSVLILFDRDLSDKGALLFIEAPEGRRRREAELEASMMFAKEYIFVPGQLPEGYKETFDGQIIKAKPRGRDRLRLFLESQKTNVPPRPAKEGYAGANVGGGNRSQHLLRKLGLLDSARLQAEDAKDPVEALRAYAQETQKAGVQSQLINRAYASTQPRTILNTSMEEEDEDELLKTKERCPRCALRMCQCGYMEEAARVDNDREKTGGRKRLKTGT